MRFLMDVLTGTFGILYCILCGIILFQIVHFLISRTKLPKWTEDLIACILRRIQGLIHKCKLHKSSV